MGEIYKIATTEVIWFSDYRDAMAALGIYDKLVSSKPGHWSPFEHIATPFTDYQYASRRKCIDACGQQALYCANFKGWTQERKLQLYENMTNKFEVRDEKSTDINSDTDRTDDVRIG